MPEQPGVYIMKNQHSEIIYVGKAVNLKNRVRQYFQSLSGQSRKVSVMVSQIKSFEYIITGTEKEAFILECNLIKKYKPKYNILLKDDKTYPYIKVTVNEEYPRVFMTRKVVKDGARYFGPYTSSNEVRETINFINKTFLIRNCKKQFRGKKDRPCLNYHIDKCMAPCQGWITSEQYKEVIKDVCNFLSGKEKELLENLENEMLTASQNMNFEKAAELRDKINSIKNMFEEQKVVSTTELDDEDAIAYAIRDGTACMQIFFIREGKLVGRKSFMIDNMEENIEDEKEMIVSFIQQFYDSIDNDNVPKYILLPIDIGEEESAIKEWLEDKKGAKVYIRVPKKGDKLKLIKMIAQNAETYLENYSKSEKVKKRQNSYAIEQLMKLTGIKVYPHRIEAYDISNTAGTDIAGSMVVFIDGEPVPSQYRRYKIKSLSQPDDYAAMQEMLFRRFRKDLNKASDNITSGVSNGIPSAIPSDSSSDSPNDIANGIANDIPSGIFNGISNNIPDNIPGRIPNNISSNIPDRVPNKISNNTSPNTSNSTSNNIANIVSDSVSKSATNSIANSIGEYPDIILIDGGLGHVNAALEVVRHYNLDIPVYGMVKDDKHRTRGLVSSEEEFDLWSNQVLLSFITKIQDEAHRFALEYNKKLRNKRYSKSVLDEIEGVGSARKKALIKHFKSIDKIKSAQVEELMQVKGISKAVALNIYEFFNKK